MEELATAFALEALIPEERDAYLTHLPGCSLCRRLVGQFQSVADSLPDSLEEEPISPGLKERILTQARMKESGETGQAGATLSEAKPSPEGWAWFAWLTPSPIAVIAVLVLAIAGIVAWNVTLQVGREDGADLTAQQHALLEAIEAGATVFQLSGTEAAPEASGSLVRDPKGERTFLLVRNLPALAAGQEFEVWRIVGDEPFSAGTFEPAKGGDQLITLPVDFSGVDAAGLSIEDEGGSPTGKPLGPIVLLGTP